MVKVKMGSKKMGARKAAKGGGAPSQKGVTGPRPSPLASGVQMDAAARQWVEVLRDPCNAPLAYPCYPTAGGGSILMRFESDVAYSSGATETGGVLIWSPGLNTSYVNNVAITTDSTLTALQANSNNNPGLAFLTAVPHTKRAVAACAQVMYPGTELNRSGVIGMGITDGSAFANNVVAGSGGNGASTTPGALRTMCQHVERTPAGVAEIKWYPGDADAVSNSPNTLVASVADIMQGRNVLIVTWSGIPVSTGMRIRLVLVVEVSLQSGQGTVATALPPVSYNSTNSILKWLFSKDPTWYIESATKAGKAVSNAISYVGAGKKAIQAFGMAAGLLL